MHSHPSKHGIHIISSFSSTYGSNAYIRSILDFVAIFPDACHRVWNCYAGKTRTAIKRLVAYARYRVPNRYTCQARAAIEDIVADACHRVRNRNARQSRAI